MCPVVHGGTLREGEVGLLLKSEQLRSCSSPLKGSAQQRVDYGPLPALVGRPLLGKLGAAVSQLLAVLVEAADGGVADAAAWQPDPARAVAQRQGLQEAALGDAPRVQDLAVPSSDPDRTKGRNLHAEVQTRTLAALIWSPLLRTSAESSRCASEAATSRRRPAPSRGGPGSR